MKRRNHHYRVFFNEYHYFEAFARNAKEAVKHAKASCRSYDGVRKPVPTKVQRCYANGNERFLSKF